MCVGYEIDGEVTTEFPPTYLLEKAKPVLEVLPQNIQHRKRHVRRSLQTAPVL